uniref:Macaca fascicularis brain cDNA, clone: QflA-22302 n=1 Tax=Macaca fascicularis TaxID=9541 RepID=I7GIS7_MACFA|nr:unnamed protein product [Macaca fascicularis]
MSFAEIKCCLEILFKYFLFLCSNVFSVDLWNVLYKAV